MHSLAFGTLKPYVDEEGHPQLTRKNLEMTLDVRPKDGMPFQARRKFVGNLGTVESGQRLAVWYDPRNPDRIEIA